MRYDTSTYRHKHTCNSFTRLGAIFIDAVEETLWPTRCAVCDTPGSILCEECTKALPYIDYWRACPRCGAPFGRTQCTECNPIMLADFDRSELPYDSCRSPLTFDRGTTRVVSVYKDAGEQRLAADMALLMVDMIAPSTLSSATVTYIPATRAAMRARGFDHGRLLAEQIAGLTDRPLATLLTHPENKDQRALDRSKRFVNMDSAFTLTNGGARKANTGAGYTTASADCTSANTGYTTVGALGTDALGKSSLGTCAPGSKAFAADSVDAKSTIESDREIPKTILLIDDVCTTGATLAAASQVLRNVGATRIDCLTFARVW